jgi:hypothetical protein
VEIQCYGLSATSSPTHTNSGSCSSGAASPSAAAACSLPSPGTSSLQQSIFYAYKYLI